MWFKLYKCCSTQINDAPFPKYILQDCGLDQSYIEVVLWQLALKGTNQVHCM